jgi:hypothetical protein
VKTEVVLEDVGVNENDARTHAAQEYSLACLKTKLKKKSFMSWKIMLGKRH